MLATLLLIACFSPQPPLRSEGYVWQRVWTDPVRDGVKTSSGVFTGFRINTASIDAGGTQVHNVDVAALRGLSARPVVRIDANLLVDPHAVGSLLEQEAARWRTAGVTVTGVEVDHDCPTRALSDYAEAIRTLRERLPADLVLSVTALPTWSSSPALTQLLAAADETVLQVHAVDAPATGLFHADRAQAAVEAYLLQTEHPLWVALPAYGMKAGGRELRVDPSEVARFMSVLDSRVVGVVWFRVPTGDARDWPLAAIEAVGAGDIPRANLWIRTEESAAGLFDLSVANDGLAWASLPRRLDVVGDCAAADGVDGYRVDRSAGLSLVRDTQEPLDPGGVRAAGWVRCTAPPEVQ